MATSKEYLDFVLDCLSHIDGISHRQMMGEYMIYFNGKLIANVCDDRFLIKPVKSALELLPNAPRECPYEGAKPMLLVEELENREFMTALFNAVYPELPLPKPKKPKKNTEKEK